MIAPVLACAQGGIVLTPSDTVSQGTFRAIYVGGVGNITIIGLDGASVLFTAVPAGTTIPVGFGKLMATGTTATNCVGLT